jgi:hypothetical protein
VQLDENVVPEDGFKSRAEQKRAAPPKDSIL